MFEVMVEHSERYLYEFFKSLNPEDRKNIGLILALKHKDEMKRA
ncbi:MAG: hypothetical protein V3T58_04300 [Candidatus Hydrothermarchaeales archaeon]